MPLSSSSRAAAVGVGVNNVPLSVSANVLPRKILLIGNYDETTFTSLTENSAFLVTSPSDVAAKSGAGFMLHRLALASFKGSQGVETWCIAQPEDGAAVQSTGDITFTLSSPESGTVYMYIGSDVVLFTITDSDTSDTCATKAAAAINADPDLPVTAVVNGVTTNQVDITSKTGSVGWDPVIGFNHKLGEAFPSGVSVAITAMSGGAGLSDIDDALNSLGSGDAANEQHFTDVNHGYPNAATTLDKISTYNGVGDDFVGLYRKTVARPFRSLCGDTANGSGGLSALLALAALRKNDRTSGVVAAPGSPHAPPEVGAQALGVLARLNNNRAQEHALNKILDGIIPGATANRWTNDYDNRDTAAKAAIGTTLTEGGVLTIQNLLTYYNPDTVPLANNVYISQRGISVIQNIVNSIKANFKSARWQGISIVEDVNKVTNAVDREKARDVDAVYDDLTALAIAFEGRSWLFNASYTIENMTVQVRPGGIGFDTVFPIYVSGEAGIYDNLVKADANFTVLLV